MSKKPLVDEYQTKYHVQYWHKHANPYLMENDEEWITAESFDKLADAKAYKGINQDIFKEKKRILKELVLRVVNVVGEYEHE